MFDNNIVNETSPEANWNRQTGAQDYVLSPADTLNKNRTWFLLSYIYAKHITLQKVVHFLNKSMDVYRTKTSVHIWKDCKKSQTVFVHPCVHEA